MHLTVTSFLVQILDSNWCDYYYYFKAVYNSGMDTSVVNELVTIMIYEVKEGSRVVNRTRMRAK